jgi:hypothetical protein
MVPWQATPLARALTTHDEFQLLASRATSARVRAALRRNRMRLLDAFRAFDGEQLGRGLHSSTSQPNLSSF